MKLRVRPGLLLAMAVACLVGCDRPKTPASAPETAPVQSETIARIHWLGKDRLAAETNAAHFMSIWNLPESAALGAQTLEKLSLAPWRLASGNAAETNAASVLLRPLLDDLVRAEWHLEVRSAERGTRNAERTSSEREVGNVASPSPGGEGRGEGERLEIVLCLRLDDTRAALWQTNLPAVLAALRQNSALRTPHSAFNVDGWTVVSFGSAGTDAGTLLAETLDRIERDHAPFAPRETNFWLEADVDLRRVAALVAPGMKLPATLPRLAATMIGDGENVRTRGELTFAKPLELKMEPWNIPTNLIHDPLVSFSAVRGIEPWLSSLNAWNDLEIGPPPNQVFTWAMEGTPLATFSAAELPNARQQVEDVSSRLAETLNPWLAAKAWGGLRLAENSCGVIWEGMPFMAPFLQLATNNNGTTFAMGGFFPGGGTNAPPPELFRQVVAVKEVVSYQWEITAQRVEAWLYVGQFARFVSRKAQISKDSVSLAWIKAAGAKLGNGVTVVSRSGSSELSFVRKSGVGLTALELHLLADWLESPEFPYGLHTFVAPEPEEPARPRP